MRPDDPLTDDAEDEIGELKIKGEANGWKQPDIDALFQAFDKWLEHPRLLDPKDSSFLRLAVLNELTWLISKPIIGEHAWEYIRRIAKRLGPEPSAIELVYAIFANVLEYDEEGNVTNLKYAEKRATDSLRAYCDPGFSVVPPYEDWEIALH